MSFFLCHEQDNIPPGNTPHHFSAHIDIVSPDQNSDKTGQAQYSRNLPRGQDRLKRLPIYPTQSAHEFRSSMVYNSPIHALCRFFPSLSPTKTYTTTTVPRSLSTDYCPQSFNMKTSILISIIATCMGLRSLANVIPPSIRELSCGATFRRHNMGMYPFSRISQCL